MMDPIPIDIVRQMLKERGYRLTSSPRSSPNQLDFQFDGKIAVQVERVNDLGNSDDFDISVDVGIVNEADRGVYMTTMLDVWKLVHEIRALLDQTNTSCRKIR
jgi:hypothetical protein